MKKLLICAVIGSTLCSPAFAQEVAPAAPAKKLATCEALAVDWRRYEENMAVRFADSVGDNSAPRATLRAMEENNDLLKANMTLQFMRDNKCTLPKQAPNGSAYISAALECSTQRLKNGYEAAKVACERSNWTPAQ